ncbi:MAG: hypothetical protein HFG31_03220 [Eubacterium sp.]|nr:hypothetical protein [Eubacterium sp.]
MKCISDKYNIYLTDDNTLLFYDTMKNGELDKPVLSVEITEGNKIILEMVEDLAQYSPEENYRYLSDWRDERVKTNLPGVIMTIIERMTGKKGV